MSHPIRPLVILGLDPGLLRTGWGVVRAEGSRLSYVAHGVIRPDDKAAFPNRLAELFAAIEEVLAAQRPDEVAVEEVFVNVNAASTLKLGHARAAALIAPARAGLPVAEYAARLVKKAVVGTGGADKDQIGFMVRRLLPACGDPGPDAADALAIAITHAHLRTAKLKGAA
jgi:crossover junction endodeoxyribonuclease RuvC